jgi:pimeloyl-ACP methyl ester carboxylesterase
VRDPSELTRDILESFRRPFRSAAGRRVVVAVSRNILCSSFFDECLPLVGQPTLVLAGSEDAYRSRDMLGVLESRIPSCTTRCLEGCRHCIHLDAPADVAELIARFCAAAEP